jgi:transcriptional regulator with XRE-family HTH domain
VFILDTLHIISQLLSQQCKTQKDLTDYLGIQKTAYTQWKLGKNNSYLKHISKIAEYLDVSADYLLGTEQKNNPLSDLDNELNIKRMAMTEEEKVKMLEYAELLISARNQHK